MVLALAVAVVVLAAVPAMAAPAGCASAGTVGNVAYVDTGVGPFCAAAADPGAKAGADGGYQADVFAADMSAGAAPSLLTVAAGPASGTPSILLHLRKQGENPALGSADLALSVVTPATTAPPAFVPACGALSPSGEVAILAGGAECSGRSVNLAAVTSAIGAAAAGGAGITLKGALTPSRKDMLVWLTVAPPPGGTGGASHVLIVLAAGA